jgi:hypothetical protein
VGFDPCLQRYTILLLPHISTETPLYSIYIYLGIVLLPFVIGTEIAIAYTSVPLSLKEFHNLRVWQAKKEAKKRRKEGFKNDLPEYKV